VTRPQELVERALQVSKADGCVVIADEVTSANLRWADNTLTTNGMTRELYLTVIAVSGRSSGVVGQSGVEATLVEDLVRAAEETARSAPPAEDYGELVVPAAGDASGGWEAGPAETGIAVFDRFARDLGAAFTEAAATDTRLYGYAAHEMRTSYVGSSAGLRLRHDQPTGHVEINGKSGDLTRSAWVGTGTRDFADVDVPALTGDLARRLDWARHTVALPAGRYQTILPPSAVADLMIDLYWSAGAREAHDGRSVFSRPGGGTRVGDRLGDVGVTLRSDPGAPVVGCASAVIAHESGGAASVFDNGLALVPTAWIDDGELTSLIQTRHSAGLTGLPVTPYIDNLIMDGPADGPGLDAMIASTERALLLTCLWYIREVDPQTLLLTGLTRDGVYLVEDGEVRGAVNNFRFNESPVDLLGRIVEIGASQPTLPREWTEYFTRTAMPPLRVDGFNMSSVSQAS
jgi:predicted Zn-dependent protease